MKFRVYADGTVIEEEYFDEWDNGQPYYDDYQEVEMPVELYDYIFRYGQEVG